MAVTNPCEFLFGVAVCPRWFWVLFRFRVGSSFLVSFQPLRERGGHIRWPQARAQLQAGRVNDRWSCFFFSFMRAADAHAHPVRGSVRLFLPLVVVSV